MHVSTSDVMSAVATIQLTVTKLHRKNLGSGCISDPHLHGKYGATANNYEI